jgi:hypothetical protein
VEPQSSASTPIRSDGGIPACSSFACAFIGMTSRLLGIVL